MVKITGLGKSTDEIVRSFEDRNRMRLPGDYRKFLLDYNGGLVESGCCNVQGVGQDVLVQVLLGVGLARDFDLQGWLSEYREEMPPSALVIAVGATGLFILVTEGVHAGVHFWDHAHAFDASLEGGNTYPVAATFAEFVDGLHPVKD